MLSSLDIQNFQSHAKTSLVFCPGVNVIVGQSDAGKSAILKALLWLITNKPTGDDFLRYGSEFVRVDLCLSDGTELSRFKSGSKNQYILGGEVLAAFGQNVPDAIAELLSIPELNIQRQHDAPFLLSIGSSEVTRIFNKIFRLEDISVCSTALNKRKLYWLSKQSSNSDQLKSTEEELDTLFFLDDFEDDLCAAEKQHSEAVLLDKRKSRLSSLIADVSRVNNSIESFAYIEPFEFDVEVTLESAQDLAKKDSAISSLRYLTTSLIQCEGSLGRYAATNELSAEIDLLQGECDSLYEKTGKVSRLSDLVDLFSRYDEQISSLDIFIAEQEKEFTDRMGPVCPLCGTER